MAGARAKPIRWDTSGYLAAIRAIMEGGRAAAQGRADLGHSIGAGLARMGAGIQQGKNRAATERQRNADRALDAQMHADRMGVQQQGMALRRMEWAAGQEKSIRADLAKLDGDLEYYAGLETLGQLDEASMAERDALLGRRSTLEESLTSVVQQGRSAAHAFSVPTQGQARSPQ